MAIIEAGVRYQYGFRCNRQRFTEEWLFAYPEGRAQKWFQRAYDPETGKDEYRFSTTFLGGRKRQDWRAQTRGNALFLSSAIQFNNEQLKPVLTWFQQRLCVIQAHRFMTPGLTMSRCRDEDRKRQVLEFMNSADLSIADIRIDTRAFSPEVLPKRCHQIKGCRSGHLRRTLTAQVKILGSHCIPAARPAGCKPAVSGSMTRVESRRAMTLVRCARRSATHRGPTGSGRGTAR